MPAASARYPDEARSRCPGWTAGPAVVLADGRPWHLPALDDALIRALGLVRDTAPDIADTAYK